MKKFLGIQKGDWKAITFCVFAAVTFWFFNAMTNEYSIDVTHPLEIDYDESQYAPIAKIPTEIRFSTTASGWDILTKTNFINASPIVLELDDFKKRKYITSTRLKTIVSKQMNGIRINDVLDDTLYVYFDKVKTKKVRLNVDARKIDLADGYRLAGAVLVEPSEAIVKGPASLLKNVPDVVNCKYTATDVSGSVDDEIEVLTNLNKQVHLSVKKIKVKFEAYQMKRLEKELDIVKLKFPKKKKIKISEEKAVLVYYIREEDEKLVESHRFEAQVNFEEISDKDKTIKIKLSRVPELVQKYEFVPAVVRVSYGE